MNLAPSVTRRSVAASTDLEGRSAAVVLRSGADRRQLPREKSVGSYELRLGGDVDRPLHVLLDGRLVGVPAAQSGDHGPVPMYVATPSG